MNEDGIERIKGDTGVAKLVAIAGDVDIDPGVPARNDMKKRIRMSKKDPDEKRDHVGDPHAREPVFYRIAHLHPYVFQ